MKVLFKNHLAKADNTLLSLAAASVCLSPVVLASEGPSLSSCPLAFHNVPLTQDAKQCQLFEDDFPASMIYHDTRTPESLIAYYQATNPTFSVHSAFNKRTLLIDQSENLRVVISPDGKGSQIDILVIAN